MWAGSPALRQWHITLAELCVHTADCQPCSRAEGQTAARCYTGQALYRAEQTAYEDWISDEYAGKATEEEWGPDSATQFLERGPG